MVGKYKYDFNIPQAVKDLLNKLHTKYEAYIVGGCVRDLLLGRTPKDYDITTNAKPNEIKELFKDYELINNNGEKHGTVTVRYNGNNYEITTYRIDGKYSDGRRPDSVAFTSNLKEDLSRRDFTINALVYDGKYVVDYFGGVNDLEAKIIRTVGDPYERFREDFLRILRGLRFACRYNFNIEKETYEAMDNSRFGLSKISVERIQSELNGILTYGENLAHRVHYGGYQHVVHHLIAEIIPELDGMSSYTFDLLENIPEDDLTLAMNLFELLRELDEDTTLNVLKRLRYSNKMIKDVLLFKAGYNKDFTDKVTLKLFLKDLRAYGYPLVTDNDKFIMFLIYMQDKNCAPITYNYVGYRQKASINLLDIEHNKECYSLDTLAINGNDLITEFGVKPGPVIKDILEGYLNDVIQGKIENNKEVLIKKVKSEIIDRL